MSWLINTLQLDKFRKAQKNIIILDASWHLPTANRNAKDEFLAEHIAGAQFFDLDLFQDSTHLPHMLVRDEHYIAEQLGAMGITNEHKLFFYDQSDCFTSARALWMLKVFGHPVHQLYLLDGGYRAWKKYGGKISEGEARQTAAKTYSVDFQSHLIRSLLQIKTNLHHPLEQVVDVRHPVRYAGGVDPRPKVRPGHIPGSFSFPYKAFFEEDGSFKAQERLRKLLTGIGIELNKPIVSMCGSGITAAILSFVLDLLGCQQHALYDGSWAEWGADEIYTGEETVQERPVITSLEK